MPAPAPALPPSPANLTPSAPSPVGLNPRPPRRSRAVAAAVALGLALALVCGLPCRLQARAQAGDDQARQVTLFGVIASPADRSVDPKLARVEPQLRKLLPDHGFRFLSVQSKRLTTGESVGAPLNGDYSATATLLDASDADGRVKIRCAVRKGEAVALESVVTTPRNQVFFCEKGLPDGTKLLVGVGAR